MKWFKFYGQDFLTDPKMRTLSIEETMCWVMLMCLANAEEKNGDIDFVSEEDVMYQAKIDIESPMWQATKGFIRKFEALRMLRVRNEGVTARNGSLHYDITLSNFSKRQEQNLDNAERQKRYRERQKQSKKQSNDSNVTQCNDSNARIEENRIEENRIYKKRIYKKRNTNKKKVIGDQEIAKTENEVKKFSPEGAEVIKMFEVVNPSYEKMYSNKTQRAAADRLLKKWTLEQIRSVVGILPKLNASKYAKGKSITPLQLEDNLGYIKAFIDQNNSQKIRRYEESDK